LLLQERGDDVTQQMTAAGPRVAPDAAWHALTPAEALRQQGVDADDGLSAAEVSERRASFGPNRFAEAAQEPRWRAFLRQYRDPMQVVLLVAGVVSLFLPNQLETAVVLIALTLLNAGMGLNQEGKASASVAALQKLIVVKAKVRRSSELVEIPMGEIVPGDIANIEAGDLVPADGRIIRAATLEIDGSALTGESAPVPKDLEAVAADAALGDRVDLAFTNTQVTRGAGSIVVTATGMQTEVGHLSGMLAVTVDEKTPLTAQLEKLTTQLLLIAHHRHRGLQGGRRDDPDRRQLRHDREGGRAGPRAIDNLMRYIRFQIAVLFGFIGTFLGASVFNILGCIPFLPLQTLWINFTTDVFQAIGLGWSKPREGLMEQAPRPKGQPILSRRLSVWLASCGLVMAAGTLGLIAWASANFDTAIAHTMGLATFSIFHLFFSLETADPERTIFSSELVDNPTLLKSTGFSILAIILATTFGPLQRILDTVDLTVEQWTLCIAVAASIVAVCEVKKVLRIHTGEEQVATMGMAPHTA
jgi:magnesium-transporting ATPase (P-type)